MTNRIDDVKRKLNNAISQLCSVSWMFSSKPGKDFTRNRKLPFRKMVEILLSMQGGTLTTELLNHFGCNPTIASSSAFVQQRGKFYAEALHFLFDLFVRETDAVKLYHGFRLIAADGSDIQIPTNPNDPDSYFPAVQGQAPYNLLHLDAMYDLLLHTYVDANLVGKRKMNERRTLCSLVDRSPMQDVLLLADRGFENYNLMAHIQEKGWSFLIRVKDITSPKGIASSLDLPDSEEFDFFVDLSLTTKQSKETKRLFEDRNHYRFVPSSSVFDYLPQTHYRDSAVFYKLPFRIVRFKITEDSYETVVTNLDAKVFNPDELKKLYAMRWGIETSFRELKHTLGLLHFHAKKAEYISQEVFARLIMYNFSELITSHVVIQKANTKLTYKANFTVAVHVCRQFFLGNVSPPDLEATIAKHVSPIRPGRSTPRNITAKRAVSFSYRVA